MTIKTIKLEVTSTFTMPSYLVSSSPEQNEYALLLASAILTSGKKYLSDNETKKLIENNHALEEKIRELHKNNTNKFANEALLQALSSHEVKRSEKEVNRLETSLTDYKKMLDDLHEKLRREEEKNEKLTNENKSLSSDLEKEKISLSNAAKRGKIGEVKFDQLTKERRPDWLLENVSGVKGAMDRFMSYKGLQIRFDIKNHSSESKVPYDPDFKKFIDNMILHKETDIGVLVALNTYIQGQTTPYETIHCEVTDTNQWLIIIPHFKEKYLESIYDYLEGLFEYVLHNKQMVTQNSSDNLNNRVNTSIQQNLSKLEKYTKAYEKFLEQKKLALGSYNQHWNTLEEILNICEDNYKSILTDYRRANDILSGKHLEIPDEVKNTLETLPMSIDTPVVVETERKKQQQQQRRKVKKQSEE